MVVPPLPPLVQAAVVRPDPAQADDGEVIRPPCGCLMWTQQGAFVIRPCSLSCPVYGYVRRKMAEQRKPVLDWFGGPG